MKLKRDYSKLYQHWLKEFEEPDLTCLLQEDFDSYKKILAEINVVQVDKTDDIKVQLIESYKKNLDYLFNDLLKIREAKIISAALANQEINLENVIETEKLLYQNLISTFKGYKKVKNLFLSEDQPMLEQEMKVDEISEEESELEKVEEIQLKEDLKPKEEKIKEKEKRYNYTLIRFLEKAEALVGIDLINYGPFEKNDIANLPYKNAVILINEKLAEKIEIS